MGLGFIWDAAIVCDMSLDEEDVAEHILAAAQVFDALRMPGPRCHFMALLLQFHEVRGNLLEAANCCLAIDDVLQTVCSRHTTTTTTTTTTDTDTTTAHTAAAAADASADGGLSYVLTETSAPRAGSRAASRSAISSRAGQSGTVGQGRAGQRSSLSLSDEGGWLFRRFLEARLAWIQRKLLLTN